MHFTFSLQMLIDTSGGFRGGAGGAPPPPPGTQILSISCSFLENLAKSYVGAIPGELAPPWGNPGSAAGYFTELYLDLVEKPKCYNSVGVSSALLFGLNKIRRATWNTAEMHSQIWYFLHSFAYVWNKTVYHKAEIYTIKV